MHTRSVASPCNSPFALLLCGKCHLVWSRVLTPRLLPGSKTRFWTSLLWKCFAIYINYLWGGNTMLIQSNSYLPFNFNVTPSIWATTLIFSRGRCPFGLNNQRLLSPALSFPLDLGYTHNCRLQFPCLVLAAPSCYHAVLILFRLCDSTGLIRCISFVSMKYESLVTLINALDNS